MGHNYSNWAQEYTVSYSVEMGVVLFHWQHKYRSSSIHVEFHFYKLIITLHFILYTKNTTFQRSRTYYTPESSLFPIVIALQVEKLVTTAVRYQRCALCHMSVTEERSNIIIWRRVLLVAYHFYCMAWCCLYKLGFGISTQYWKAKQMQHWCWN